VKLRGSCRCGGIRFEIHGPLMGVGHCHCNACRKSQGAAFRTRARVRRSDFRWIDGEDLMRSSQSTPGFFRGFCGRCGAPVVNWNTAESEYGQRSPASLETYGIAIASLDDDPGVTPGFHAFVAFKAPWFAITDDLPQFPGFPDPSDMTRDPSPNRSEPL
jgi:hypothetical protein